MSITFATTAAGGPQVNLSNQNAAQLLDLLGLPWDGDWAEAPAEDILGRVLLAQALLPAATDDGHGQPTVVERNWIDCGRRPGYLADKLAELHQIATWAHERRAAVMWS